jgi:hypothetical protein
MRAFFAFLITIATGVIANDGIMPSKLRMGIEGFAGVSYRAELVSGKSAIVYLFNPRTFTSWKGTKRRTIPIPSERWIAFHQSLDQARIWNWKSKYVDPNVADGTVWDIEIAWGDRTIKSRGSNAYPDSKQFEIYRKAVEELLGHPFK